MEIEKISPHNVASQNTKSLKQRSQTPNPSTKLSQLNKAYPSYMEIEKITPNRMNIHEYNSQIKNNARV